MPLGNRPTRKQLLDRGRSDFKAVVPESDPYNETSLVNAHLVAKANRISELLDQVEIVARDAFATTAQGDAMLEKALELGLTLNEATPANGNVILTGTAGVIINIGTSITGANATYNTLSSAVIGAESRSVSVLNSATGIATVNTASPHNYGTGQTITISGANEAEYNGDFEVTVVDADTFTYAVSGTPASPATGTIISSSVQVLVAVQSSSTGADQNAQAGSSLALSSGLVGVDTAIFSDYLGIDGGADQETIEELRERYLFKNANPATNFNKSDISNKAKEVTGVTRVFIYEPNDLPRTSAVTSAIALNGYVEVDFGATEHGLSTGMQIDISGANEPLFNGKKDILVKSSTVVTFYNASISDSTATGSIIAEHGSVQLGQVRVFFVRDNDTDIIPSASEVIDVKNKILEIKPAQTHDNDVIVEAPVSVPKDFNISSLSPDTVGIRDAIRTNLEQLFTDTGLGETITESQYRTAIQVSFDAETAQGLTSFTLSETTDLTSSFNEILTIGSVNIS